MGKPNLFFLPLFRLSRMLSLAIVMRPKSTMCNSEEEGDRWVFAPATSLPSACLPGHFLELQEKGVGGQRLSFSPLFAYRFRCFFFNIVPPPPTPSPSPHPLPFPKTSLSLSLSTHTYTLIHTFPLFPRRNTPGSGGGGLAGKKRGHWGSKSAEELGAHHDVIRVDKGSKPRDLWSGGVKAVAEQRMRYEYDCCLFFALSFSLTHSLTLPLSPRMRRVRPKRPGSWSQSQKFNAGQTSAMSLPLLIRNLIFRTY